jgi:hypothetical protein
VDREAYNALDLIEDEDDDHEETETVFWIDCNIDGVQFFENSVKTCGEPILIRIYKVIRRVNDQWDKLVVPMDMAVVIVAGLYFGEGKPPRAFLEPFLQEVFDKLNPGKQENHRKRVCAVILRCFIADWLARIELKGEQSLVDKYSITLNKGSLASMILLFVCAVSSSNKKTCKSPYFGLICAAVDFLSFRFQLRKSNWTPKYVNHGSSFFFLEFPFDFIYS